MKRDFECVILAGGKGERLKPLTDTRPKPLCRVGGLSCLEKCVIEARKASPCRITVSACFMAEQITEECRRLGVFSHVDETPAGTAGACRRCAGGDRTVLVLSGDGWFDFDLKKIVDAHFESGLECTVALTGSETPDIYGCAQVKDGVITRFDEKPSWINVRGSEVNTGIYVLSPAVLGMIPPDVSYDFACDLFPALFDAGIPVNACAADGFWCDIGDPASYLKCCMRVSGGRNDVAASAVIESGARITQSVIGENARIGAGSVIDRAVIAENCMIGANSLIKPGCALGGGCALGEGTVLEENVYLAAGTKTEYGSHVRKDVKSGVAKGKLFDTDDGVGGVYGGGFSPGEALDAGAACAGAARRIGVMWSENAESELLANAFACGARFGGSSVCVLGTGFEGLAAFCGGEYGLDLTAFTECRVHDVRLVLRTRGGALVSGRLKNKIERAYGAGPAGAAVPGRTEQPRGHLSPVCRFADSLRAVCGDLSGAKINLPSFNETSAVFRTVCVSLGAKVAQDAGAAISFTPDGVGIMLTTDDGRVFDRWQLLSFICARGGDDAAYLPEDAPISAEEYITSHGKRVERQSSRLEACVYSAAHAAASLLGICAAEKRDILDITSDIPVFAVRGATVPFPMERKAEFAGKLCREFGSDIPLYTGKRGKVRFFPDSPKGFRVVAEAASAEYADELCEFGKRVVSEPERFLNH